MELQYDFDKKQKAAEYERMEERILHENQIRQQRQAMFGLLILVILVALISFLLLRHSRLRSRLTQIDLEQRLLRAQMNPHFIFNSLCAVQDFILAGKPQKANTFLTKIARLMRNILENSREEFIPLEKEIETIKLYLDLQQLRFETGFEYNISLDENIDPENLSIPPMLTQPCVENSIEHGLLPLKEKGQLKITYSFRNGMMMLEVTDNGIGRKEAASRASEKKNKKSVSTQVTRERLENFRKTLRQKSISYEIIDLYDTDRAAGTKVVMMLPFKKIYA
jgi:LytS/YehU family sensor histidine kinase